MAEQQTRCWQGKQTTPLSLSLKTWQISIFIRLTYSSWSTWMSVKRYIFAISWLLSIVNGVIVKINQFSPFAIFKKCYMWMLSLRTFLKSLLSNITSTTTTKLVLTFMHIWTLFFFHPWKRSLVLAWRTKCKNKIRHLV